jgi:hypothetical protein
MPVLPAFGSRGAKWGGVPYIVISKLEIKITKKNLPGARDNSDESRLEPLFVVIGWMCDVTWQQGPKTRLKPHSLSSGGDVDHVV